MINAELENYWSEKGWWETINWEAFKAYWPLATEDEKPKNAYGIKGPCRISYEEANALAAMGVKMELLPLPGAMLTKMKDHGRYAWEQPAIQPEDLMNGKAVQIVVPDMAIMLINEVIVENDCCTDQLQTLLDEGWRILAVCPPCAQRRPDFVLGRVKAKLDR